MYEGNWNSFKAILVNNPMMFSAKFFDRKLFYYIYGFVCTRCYGGVGYASTSAALVPMADNVNHNSVEYLNGTVVISLIEKG